jgi:metal-sulfur cluster biosynthetic enzyme
MGLLRSVEVVDRHARVELLLTSGWCPFAGRVLTDVADAIGAQPGIDSCDVEIVWDEAWTTDRLSPSALRKLRFLPDPVAVGDRDAYLSTHPTTRLSTHPTTRLAPHIPEEDSHDR